MTQTETTNAETPAGPGTAPGWPEPGVLLAAAAERELRKLLATGCLGDALSGALGMLLGELERVRALHPHEFAATADGEPTACACGMTYLAYDRGTDGRMATALERERGAPGSEGHFCGAGPGS